MSPDRSPITQRAYTLRLSRAPGKCDSCQREECHCWHEALWRTHWSVNAGARAFGDWLLTLRGGLHHELADAPVPAGGASSSRQLSREERRDRRVLLALSWLSVEDARGAPSDNDLRIADAALDGKARGEAVKRALRELLRKRGVKNDDVESWLRDCGPSLEASIREDAVWVNRSLAFDKAVRRWNSLTREDARRVLEQFFGEIYAYLRLDPSPSDAENGAASAAIAQGVEFRTVARGWVSSNFGTGKKTDPAAISSHLDKLVQMDLSKYVGKNGRDLANAIAKSVGAAVAESTESTVAAICATIGWSTGRRSSGRIAIESICRKDTLVKDDLDALIMKLRKEAESKKAGRQQCAWASTFRESLEKTIEFSYVSERNMTGEYSTMLDHAARRVSIAHSWIKIAEQRRRTFEETAKKFDSLNQRAPGAIEWLNSFGDRRSVATGASGEPGYRIRPRAIAGWRNVVQAWSQPSCQTMEDRIIAARALQDDPEIDKFGDIQLFEALADDNAKCVWHDQDNLPDSSILEDYVAAATAEYDRRRFKVPAYRHPDALRHPVFCDFGESRWTIRFACHRPARAPKGKNGPAATDSRHGENRHGLTMDLWNGKSVRPVLMRWSSKRLTNDLALDAHPDATGREVTRADRLGKAASGADHAKIMNVFEEKEWNGRLQAPRVQLNRIARLEDKGNHAMATALRTRLRWLVSFSPRLRPSGPFIEYAKAHGIQPNRKGEYWPSASINKGRGQLARLALGRLSGLRVLAVDLGHRYAAACAVWQTLDAKEFQKDISGHKVVAGGPGPDNLYLHLKILTRDGRTRTSIYRRLGADVLPDGRPSPAPWARLDRQFLIKLQGEDRPARKAAPHEIEIVQRWESIIGRVRKENADELPRRIDLLMAETVTTLRRALRRHGDRARIAFNLKAMAKATASGDQQQLDHESRVRSLAETLAIWHGLFSDQRWEDPWAAAEWRRRGLSATGPGVPEDGSGGAPQARRNELEAFYQDLAKRLVDLDLSEWSEAWTVRWEEDDRQWSAKTGLLRSLKRWIAPRGLRTLASDDDATRTDKGAARAAARHVGGLSMERINTVSALYQLLKAFRMRPEPGDLRRNIPKDGDDQLKDFNRRLLEMRDRLREQRVKQLASRIVEAALGVGSEDRQHWTGGRRPQRRIGEPRFDPCHAVVIESLKHYRPDELRTRRENRLLMQWSSGKVRKFLEEECQLHGLYLYEIAPNYTSRQCSRTGLPGMRCDDVPAGEFLDAPWWKKRIKAAKDSRAKDTCSAMDIFLGNLATRLEGLRKESKPLPETVRVPREGGDIFIAVPHVGQPEDRSDAQANRHQRSAIQADLNAAANIGLRALLDPDWPGRWWYVPCEAGSFAPVADKIKGCAAFNGITALPVCCGTTPIKQSGQNRQPRRGQSRPTKDIMNLWRDPKAVALSEAPWQTYQAYWNDVQERVIELLRRQNGIST